LPSKQLITKSCQKKVASQKKVARQTVDKKPIYRPKKLGNKLSFNKKEA